MVTHTHKVISKETSLHYLTLNIQASNNKVGFELGGVVRTKTKRTGLRCCNYLGRQETKERGFPSILLLITPGSFRIITAGELRCWAPRYACLVVAFKNDLQIKRSPTPDDARTIHDTHRQCFDVKNIFADIQYMLLHDENCASVKGQTGCGLHSLSQ